MMMTTEPDSLMLTERQRRLIRHSFTRVARRYNLIANLMFDRLLLLHPDLQPFFPENRTDLNRKLMEMLALIVQRLDDPGALQRLISKVTHRAGVADALGHDPAAFADAFLWSLRYGLATGYNDELEAAWSQLAAHVVETATQS